ncbi:MarR family winged helix-turn-helix transcriptional regulator [Caulobacter sp. KR2-114]|uniref:MarR family winged helix-turn-helix transcriptional regulator n=1 Tax=Caulobacter sp. KR2-114 TaxID=3400912 RepID=UPI003C021ED3
MARAIKLGPSEYQRLAAFRLALREFLARTEANARSVGLTPQQHQALLSIKGGYPGRETISISELAQHLLIKNHSAVELVARLVNAGLVVREPSREDRRTVCVSITAKGEEILGELSKAGFEELATSAEALRGLVAELEQFRD